MGGFGWGRALAAALSAAALASAATPAAAGWPNADPAQPLVQAPLRCALGIVPINRRCHVMDYADLGDIQGREWYYAFYHTHWADRHGKMDRGFPIFFYLQKPATLRLGLWVNDAPGLAGTWARTPPPRPVVIERPEAVYLGLTLKAVEGQDDQRLFRLDGVRWKSVSILYPSEQDRAILAAVTPRHCEPVDDGEYDWSSFRLVMALKAEGSGDPCGVIEAGLEVRKDRVYLTDARLDPAPESTPSPRRP
ncbi:MAG: hypothetical protein JO303_14485 [Caulobacteraceae bacterium]|nr:hypothetical protein [Caulobacteraceae bacterium]